MKTDTLSWFVNNVAKITSEDLVILNEARVGDKIIVDNEDKELTQEFFNRMLYSGLSSETHTIRFDECATNLIKALFKRYGSDDTLIISTQCEHTNVNDILNEHTNVYRLDPISEIKTSNLLKLKNYIESYGYKKAFVYIIGTQISNGLITSNEFFKNLTETLKSLNIDVIYTLDAVQEMFVLPRDYTMFDYVIGTGHSLVVEYDLGMLISKRERENFGYLIDNWSRDYLRHIDLVISKMKSLLYYKFALKEYFSDSLLPEYKIVEDSTPQIFAISVPKTTVISNSLIEKLREEFIYFDGFDKDDVEYRYIRIRWQQLISQPERLINAMKLLKMYFMELKEV